MPVLTETHAHHWDIDSRNHGVCSCGAEKQFPQVLWYAVKSEQKNRELFNKTGNRQEKIDSSKAKEEKMEIPKQEQKLVHDTPAETTTMPEFNGKPSVTEPDRKKDFNGWLDFHRVELITDHETLPALNFRYKWHFNPPQVGDMLKYFGLHKLSRTSVKKAKKSGTLCKTCANNDLCEIGRDIPEACAGYEQKPKPGDCDTCEWSHAPDGDFIGCQNPTPCKGFSEFRQTITTDAQKPLAGELDAKAGQSGDTPDTEKPDAPTNPLSMGLDEILTACKMTLESNKRVLAELEAAPKLPPLPPFELVAAEHQGKWLEIYARLVGDDKTYLNFKGATVGAPVEVQDAK
jgi:hypothetical protein